MAFNVIIVISALIGIAFGQSTSTTPSPWSDPYSGGKYGNPGARASLCKKSMDAIHEYASDMMGRAILVMTLPDLYLPVGAGTLFIKPPRVTEAQYGKSEYHMLPPNQIRSHFYDGRIAATGIWLYKPHSGDLMGGRYKATIQGTDIDAVNKLGRSSDAKPTIENVGCEASMSNFRIEVQGCDEIEVIENCTMEFCVRIQKFFENAVCDLFGAFVKEIINRELQQVPNRMSIQGDQYKVDYGLLFNEPTVNDTDQCIRARMEGKYIWRSWNAVPFNPPQMDWLNSNRMYSFQISDFTFNTLFHQAHSSGHRFSAAELSSPAIQQLLSLNCDVASTSTQPSTSTSKPTRPVDRRRFRGPPGPNVGAVAVGYQTTPNCLGSLLANFSNFGPYSASDSGDVVFKTNYKASSIYVESDKRALFDGSSGAIEFYGPVGQGTFRSLLARADIQLLRGDFEPKINKTNITGSVKITKLQLMSPNRMMTPEWLDSAAQFATPIITDTINAFLDRYAQFPVPLPKKFQCSSPEFKILARTMQIDCDVEPAKRNGDSDESEEDEESTCKCFRSACVCPNQ